MMENREKKIGWKIAFFTVWLRGWGGGGEKSGGTHQFSLLLLQNTISPNWRELEWKVGKIFGQNCHHIFFTFLASSSFFSFFFFFSFDFSFVTLAFFFSLVLPNGGFFFFSFFFFLIFIFIIFLGKHFWMISYAIFWNVNFHLYTILKKIYNVLLFILFKRDMMVNLYKLYFQLNQKFSIPPFFQPLNQT